MLPIWELRRASHPSPDDAVKDEDPEDPDVPDDPVEPVDDSIV